MREMWFRVIFVSLSIFLLISCQQHAVVSYGQQYKDGQLTSKLVPVTKPNVNGKPINSSDFINQILTINKISPHLYSGYYSTYNAIMSWLNSNASPDQLHQFGLSIYQMQGQDHQGNVKFTGYYTPIIEARSQPDNTFRYPIYRMPSYKGQLPPRQEIYNGALADQQLEIAYSSSLIDNFMMEVQGSAYLNLDNEQPLNFFAYAGKNGHSYHSIGRVLIDRQQITKDAMSMQAIYQWVAQHNETEVMELFSQNPSFVFFVNKGVAQVKGASGVPLIAKTAVAADRKLIAPGTPLLAEVPILNEQGLFTGKYELRLMIALDVGGAIKGNHFDIYHGIGKHAGNEAGFFNHYGRVWVLTTTADTMDQLLLNANLSYTKFN